MKYFRTCQGTVLLAFFTLPLFAQPTTTFKDCFNSWHRGRVENADGEALADVKVSLNYYFGYDVGTAADGEYLFDPVPASLDCFAKHLFTFRKSGYARLDTMVFLYDKPTVTLRRSPEIWIQVWGDAAHTMPLGRVAADIAFPGGVRRAISDSSGYLRVLLPASLPHNKQLRITFTGMGRVVVMREHPVGEWLDKTSDVVLPPLPPAARSSPAKPEPSAPGPGSPKFEASRTAVSAAYNRLVNNPGDTALVRAFLTRLEQLENQRLSPNDLLIWQSEREGYLKVRDYFRDAVGPGNACSQACTRRVQEWRKFEAQHQIAGELPVGPEKFKRLDELVETGFRIIEYDLDAARTCQDCSYAQDAKLDSVTLRDQIKGEEEILPKWLAAGLISRSVYETRKAAVADYLQRLTLLLEEANRLLGRC